MTQGKHCTAFNYCFWAKLVVAIPAIPMVAFVASSFFTNIYAQLAAASAAIAATIWLAIKIDTMPLFAGKVVKRSCGACKDDTGSSA